ncbi:hypothetical protein BASA81_012441 [Batrachochytrium salamandrivorans]|nr:hypothetical protein BASA81_012441 [Batrachochytrium salamandrivorans]
MSSFKQSSIILIIFHDRQPIQVSRDTPPIRNSDIFDQDFSWNQIAAALLQMSPRKAPGDDGITTAFYQAALYMPANIQEGAPPTPFARALLRVCGQVFASATILRLADFLQVAYRQYQSTLWQISPGSPCGSWLTDF